MVTDRDHPRPSVSKPERPTGGDGHRSQARTPTARDHERRSALEHKRPTARGGHRPGVRKPNPPAITTVTEPERRLPEFTSVWRTIARTPARDHHRPGSRTPDRPRSPPPRKPDADRPGSRAPERLGNRLLDRLGGPAIRRSVGDAAVGTGHPALHRATAVGEGRTPHPESMSLGRRARMATGRRVARCKAAPPARAWSVALPLWRADRRSAAPPLRRAAGPRIPATERGPGLRRRG